VRTISRMINSAVAPAQVVRGVAETNL